MPSTKPLCLPVKVFETKRKTKSKSKHDIKNIDCCKENGDEDPNLIWFYYFAQNLTQIILSMPGLKHVEGINLPGILAFLLKNCKKTSHLKHMFYQKTMIYLRKHFKSRTTTTTR